MLTSSAIYNAFRSIHARSDPEAVDPEVVKEFFSGSLIEQYFNVALASALVYHSLITIDQEVKYFWPRPLNSISLIYFANRCVGLLGAISFIAADGFKESILRSIHALDEFTVQFGHDSTDRLHTRCPGFDTLPSGRLAIFLKLLIGLEAAIDLSILVYALLLEGVVVGELAEGIIVCEALRAPPEVLSTISWVVPMIFGLLFLSLALYKAAEYWRLSSGFKGFYLVKILIRDQALYYGCVILCYTLQIVADHVFQFNDFAGSLLNAAGSPTLLCILGGQLLINLKEAGELGVNGGTNYRSKSVSDIDFAEVVDAPREEDRSLENAEDAPSFEGNPST